MHGNRGMKTMRVFTVALASLAFCIAGCSTGTRRARRRRPKPVTETVPASVDEDVAKEAPAPAAAVETPASEAAVEKAPAPKAAVEKSAAPKATVEAAPAPKPADRKAAAVRRAMRPLELPEVKASTAEEFLERYTGMLKQLRAELTAKVPQVGPAQRQAFESAAKAVAAASDQVKKAERTRDQKARDAKLKAANDALARAKARMDKVLEEIKLREFLASDALDAKFAKYVVLLEATPKGLAEFAAKGKEQAGPVELMLSDADLMKQMIVADGAKTKKEGKSQGPGQYGPAMKIYVDIQRSSDKASRGVLQRLALAIALEHAVPISQRNPKADTDAPAFVDPVGRYLQYEKAFQGGELDPAFRKLTAWDLRFVVHGNEPDWTLVWGREMVRNFHPEQTYAESYGWKYVGVVRTDVRYGSGDVKYDRPELQFFQNIIMNGGVCGRRAFFGRFLCRAFGIPTTARPSRGHAALAHWTPKGWVVNLGGGWGGGWTKTLYNKDLDFLASTQARGNPKAYLQVKRAQWVGDVAGEKRTYGDHGGLPAFWNSVALYTQRAIIQESKAVELAALGEELGEANEPTVAEAIMAAPVTAKDKEIAYGGDGVITIPAAAYVKNSRDVKAVKSFAGGLQIFLPRFSPKGTTVLRGGAWRGDANGCKSGNRLKSGG
ncbi:MAG: hypothetical protein ACYS9X_20475, partial [Planctomycetota bacterium]